MSGSRVVSINVSNGGVPKLPVASAQVTKRGVAGDRQRDLRYHGGPDRAVSLYARERIEALRAEGHPIEPGSAGENLTLEGLDWDTLAPGARLAVGEACQLEITAFANPCQKIAGSFADGDYPRLSSKRHPGWARLYARVLAEGLVKKGDAVRLLPG